MTEPIELIRDVDGEPMLSSDALSLLFGVGADLIKACSLKRTRDGYTSFPEAWLKAGRRRAKEAAAATGENDLFTILSYWAKRDRDAVIVLVEEDQ